MADLPNLRPATRKPAASSPLHQQPPSIRRLVRLVILLQLGTAVFSVLVFLMMLILLYG